MTERNQLDQTLVNRRIRVLIIYNTTWYVYILRRRLIEEMLGKGWEVVVLSPSDEYVERLTGLGCTHVPWRVSRSGMHPVREVMSLLSLLVHLLKWRPDIVLTYTIKPNIYGGMVCRCLGIKVISNVAGLGYIFAKGGSLARLARHLYAFAFRKTYRVFFQNPDDKSLFEDLRIVTSAQSMLLPGSGVDLDAFSPRDRGPAGGAFVFVLVARLLKEKGIEDYVVAARSVRARHRNCEFWLIGSLDVENPSCIGKDQLEEWVEEGVISYAGYVDEIRPFLERAHCAVLPSYYREGIPRSLLEALACGLPIITTSMPGCKEVVEDGINGFVCTPRDAESLVVAMEKLLALSPLELGAMMVASRSLAERRFDEGIVIHSYLDAIESANGRSQAISQ